MAADSAGDLDQLCIDVFYRNTNDWKKPDDRFNSFFRFADGKGINNTSGFRPKSKAGGSTDIVNCAFCVLVTTFGETEWPDTMDPETGRFVYFGDNRAKGVQLHDTAVGGNRLLQNVYSLLHTHKRATIPPFLCFETVKGSGGTFMRFLGLASPGGEGVSALDDLVAVWRVKGEDRFQNYRATLTILKEEIVLKSWLEDMVAGTLPAESTYCPKSWKLWVKQGRYTPLKCTRRIQPRSRKEQEPADATESRILQKIFDSLSARQFEFAAAKLLHLMDERFFDVEVTRAVRDGGRDVVAEYRVGHAQHQVKLSAYVEAKRWSLASAVGVKPMMRLIARLKHRDIGVFVTTSFFDEQVQKELIEDGHPVILLSGGDIARLLIRKDLAAATSLQAWLDEIAQQAAEADGLS